MKTKMLTGSILLVVTILCAWSAGAQETPAPQPNPPAAAPAAPAGPPAAAAANPPTAAPANPTAAAKPSPVSVEPKSAPAAEQITLLTMIRWGGAILWVLMAMGFVALVMAMYLLLTVTPKREVPLSFYKRAMGLIRVGDLRGAYQMCEGRDELLVTVVRAGLKMAGHDRFVIQEAMESEGERGAMSLWQKIFYLNNIGVVAPLVGLLGTVWGMVLAFSAIASDNAQVKSMAVASCVSKAMICTVGGLVVAIPSLVVYYYLRGRVVKIIASVEAQASEIVEVLARGKDR